MANSPTIADIIKYCLREYGFENIPEAQSMAIELAARVKEWCSMSWSQMVASILPCGHTNAEHMYYLEDAGFEIEWTDACDKAEQAKRAPQSSPHPDK